MNRSSFRRIVLLAAVVLAIGLQGCAGQTAGNATGPWHSGNAPYYAPYSGTGPAGMGVQ